MGCILDVSIVSDLRGLVIIRAFGLELPWENQQFWWLDDPADRVPAENVYEFPS